MIHRTTGSTASLWTAYDQIDIADVAVDVEAPDLLPTYSYRVPQSLGDAARIGMCVHVPFGGQERLGYVIARRRIAAADPLAARLRDIEAIVEGAVTFGAEQAEVALWMAERYVCDLAAAIRCIAPATMGSKVRHILKLADSALTGKDAGDSLVQQHILETIRGLGGEAEADQLRDAARVSAFNGSLRALVRKGLIEERREAARPQIVTRTVRAYELGPAAGALDGNLSAQGKRLLEALAELQREGQTPALPEKLLTRAACSSAPLKTLVEKGAVVVREVSVRRSPLRVPDRRTQPPALTPGQAGASRRIAEMIAGSGAAHQALLFGVTASGKTEVYLDAISKTLDSGRGAIVLVPEIALTTQVVEIFTGRFGDEVAVLHSRLSGGEKHDEWRRLQEGRARIAVGARSAAFAPVDNLGLIVMDEEHEASYKQESMPRYHARDVAAERARLAGATLVLGSATPALETFHAAESGTVDLLEMAERVESRPLPVVSVVDLRKEFRDHKALFSRQLESEIGERLAKRQQIILFLNRRGYAQFVLCRDCGYVARCPNCAVSLTFHSAWNGLKCHHCDYGRRAPTVCPECGGSRIKAFGLGTERVEEEVRKLFPEARIARMDRDTTSRKGAHAGLLRQFREGEADILIGTQMVAKGLDFPNVTLVGVISADTSINMPDFRAGERTFQLLTQVAGRAGRGQHPGSVTIQTFNPEHYSVQMAMSQDYRGFYEKEIKFREELRYPPFSRFANIVASDDDSKIARGRAEAFATAIRAECGEEVEVIGPAPAPLSRLRGSYRWHVVVRAPTDWPLSTSLRNALARITSAERLRLSIDVDPMSMA